MNIHPRAREAAIRMIKRLMKDYDRDLTHAIALTAVSTMIPIHDLQKLWDCHLAEEKCKVEEAK